MTLRKLNRSDIQKLEEYWINHKENERRLKFREWELTSKASDDENTGAGSNSVRNTSSETENLAIKLMSDKLYQNLLTITKAVNNIYKSCDEDMSLIVEMRYWDEDRNCYEWEEIADQLNMSRAKVLRLRNEILKETAELIGWV